MGARNMTGFENKVVLVTGASSGIGEYLGRRFYELGACVALCSRSKERVDQSVSAYAGADDPRVLTMTADMTKPEDIRAFADAAVKRFGHIDVLINNAGLSHPKPTVEVTEEDFNVTVETKLRGYFFMAAAAAADMLKRGEGGAVINIGSVQSATVIPGQAVYASTNAGICQMTRSHAREWGKAGIRVNCIAPGSIHTPENAARYADPAVEQSMCEKIPLGYRGYVEQIADAAVFFASQASSYVTGQTLYVDGGLSLIQG